MGLENRDYYRDKHEWGRQWHPDDDRRRRAYSTGSHRAITTLILINVAVAILDLFFPRVQLSPDETAMMTGQQIAEIEQNAPHMLTQLLALDTDLAERPWKIYTLVTHGFAHAPLDGRRPGLFHLLGNMLALFFLGRMVEARLGYYEFLRFYLLAMVVAGLAFLIWHWAIGEPASAVGASGAVTAVVMAFVFMFPHEKVLLFFVLPVPAWALGVLIVFGDIWSSFSPASRIAVQEHLAGAAFGAAYCYFGWNLRWLRIERLKRLFKRGPKLKIHREDPLDSLRAEGDRILQKIAEQGESSLTNRERRTLKKYSEQIRRQRP